MIILSVSNHLKFKLISKYKPAGDQPQAIKALVDGINVNQRDQVLLGVTGSGKTFTMAQIIQITQKPALIMAHNKTLAAQIYTEMKDFFPDNAVEYFVSYYDYYQPEAYVARTDTYIEKDSSINEQIDRLRHSATRNLLERRDVIVVCSVSCIYGLGSPELYSGMKFTVKKLEKINREVLLKELVTLQYERHDMDFKRSTFRVRGDSVDILPSHLEDVAWRVSLFGDEIDEILEIDPLTGEIKRALDEITIYPSSHYVTPKPTLEKAIRQIKEDLKIRLKQLESANKLVEAQRLEQRTKFDLEMIVETGSCKGIENYSRYLSGHAAGEPPPTLFEYLPPDALLFVDESHVTMPQIGAMYKGDQVRKSTLSEYGFRLPSCLDNRPLKFEEWDKFRPQTIYVSATPAAEEIRRADGRVVEQIIRPTGLTDPPCFVRPIASQVDDLIAECRECIAKGYRALVITLTKRMAEDLTDYLAEVGMKVRYLHSDVDTLERIEIIRDLRMGVFDILVGINLLREGLDIPECALVAILDADKEGFLRSETSLVQTIGRAARNVDGKVVLYADKMTGSLQRALDETERRRKIQIAYNKQHGITPATVKKSINSALDGMMQKNNADKSAIMTPSLKKPIKNREQYIEQLKKKMLAAAADLDFEKASMYRDEIKALQLGELYS